MYVCAYGGVVKGEGVEVEHVLRVVSEEEAISLPGLVVGDFPVALEIEGRGEDEDVEERGVEELLGVVGNGLLCGCRWSRSG